MPHKLFRQFGSDESVAELAPNSTGELEISMGETQMGLSGPKIGLWQKKSHITFSAMFGTCFTLYSLIAQLLQVQKPVNGG